jgi:hypothetical protein
VRADGGFQVDGQTVIDADAGWHRSYGNTGWYNETHGGGWYMADSTWIRSYGGKNVYHDTGVLRTDGILQVGPDGNRFVVNTSGNIGMSSDRFFGHSPRDKFIYDGKEMGHYSLGWFSDSWESGAATAWLSGYSGVKLFSRGELRFWVEGGGNVRYAVSSERSSSRELKESIAVLPAQEAIETLEGLNPVKYNLKADKEKNLHIGFIAEDVPDLVASRDRKAISTDHIVAVLTKVVKEQHKTISVLTEKIKGLEKQN